MNNMAEVFDSTGLRVLREDAYKWYAIRLNWTRPRGRKVSWKRLNRPQRYQAMIGYVEAMIDYVVAQTERAAHTLGQEIMARYLEGFVH